MPTTFDAAHNKTFDDISGYCFARPTLQNQKMLILLLLILIYVNITTTLKQETESFHIWEA